ncbi:MAG TPA: hypothetical protein DIT48_05505 [Actinobacteria bacterium]|nr:hypothetical protein [Actinomycetota bacterium]
MAWMSLGHHASISAYERQILLPSQVHRGRVGHGVHHVRRLDPAARDDRRQFLSCPLCNPRVRFILRGLGPTRASQVTGILVP